MYLLKLNCLFRIDPSTIETPSTDEDGNTLRHSMIKTIAHDLAQMLLNRYSNLKIKFLHQGSAWYSVEHLYDVDVLLVFSEQYDVNRLLPLFQDHIVASVGSSASHSNLCEHSKQVKPTLAVAAWMTDNFDRWLTRPWLGHYDLLLTTSQRASQFFHKLSSTIGFPMQCAIGCPQDRRRLPRGVKGLDIPFKSRSGIEVDKLEMPIASTTTSDPANHHIMETDKLFAGLDFVIVLADTFRKVDSKESRGIDLDSLSTALSAHSLHSKRGKIVIGYFRDVHAHQAKAHSQGHSEHHHQDHQNSSKPSLKSQRKHKTPFGASQHRQLETEVSSNVDSRNEFMNIELVSYEVLREVTHQFLHFARALF